MIRTQAPPVSPLGEEGPPARWPRIAACTARRLISTDLARRGETPLSLAAGPARAGGAGRGHRQRAPHVRDSPCRGEPRSIADFGQRAPSCARRLRSLRPRPRLRRSASPAARAQPTENPHVDRDSLGPRSSGDAASRRDVGRMATERMCSAARNRTSVARRPGDCARRPRRSICRPSVVRARRRCRPGSLFWSSFHHATRLDRMIPRSGSGRGDPARPAGSLRVHRPPQPGSLRVSAASACGA